MGHWYGNEWSTLETVQPHHARIVPDVTLREARKHNLFPGITSIISEMARPGLERWKMLEVAKIAADNPQISPSQCIRLHTQNVAEKADAGTEIHKLVEDAANDWVPGATPVEEGAFLLSEIIEQACVATGVVLGSPPVKFIDTPDCIFSERALAHPDGYATKVDLELHYYGDDSACKLVDIKTKPIWPDSDPPRIQEEHLMQMAACRDLPAFGGDCNHEIPPECWIAFVSREKDAADNHKVHLVQIEESELARGLAMFKAANMLFRLRRNFYPGKRA